jgi:hypothetical protein
MNGEEKKSIPGSKTQIRAVENLWNNLIRGRKLSLFSIG